MGLNTNITTSKGLSNHLVIIDKIVTNVDINQPILCQGNHFIWNIHNQMKKNITKMDKSMEPSEKILYTTDEVKFVLGNLYQCLNITKPEEFETIDQNRLTKCIGENTYEKTKRDTGWLLFILGEGQ